MNPIAAGALVLTVAYAIIGNALVLLVLLHRQTPLRMMLTGMPFYLYGVCNRSTPPAGRFVRAFALSTDVSLLLAIPSCIWFVSTLN